MKKLLLLFITLCITSCNAQDCETLPKSYSSYSQAVSKITNANFSFTDSVNTSSSSWITDANFYSCDGEKGFLLIETKKTNYIFKNVPIRLWNNFKKAKSFGKFYNKNIRGKFKLAV
jgi:hypothetical protein